jgi:hypothetical protein
MNNKDGLVNGTVKKSSSINVHFLRSIMLQLLETIHQVRHPRRNQLQLKLLLLTVVFVLQNAEGLPIQCRASDRVLNATLPDDQPKENSLVAEPDAINQSSSDIGNDSRSTKEEAAKEELKEWLTVVSDNTLEMHKREMPAYWRLISLAKAETFSSMTERARKSPAFSEFFLAAPEHRGELVSLDVNVRRVLKYPVNEGNPAKVQNLYEIWGWTNQAKSWLYVFVTPELPEGSNESTLVNRTVTFTGYFFKLQGYHSGMARQNNQPLVAPLLIGKLAPHKASESSKQQPNLRFYLVALCVLGICGLRVLMKYLLRPKQASFSTGYKTMSNRPAENDAKFDWLDIDDTEVKQPKSGE